MEKTKPSRPRKAKRSKPTTTVKRINADDNPSKYAKPTDMVAEPILGREPEFVTHVGLGNLEVITANGLKEEEEND